MVYLTSSNLGQLTMRPIEGTKVMKAAVAAKAAIVVEAAEAAKAAEV